MNMAITKVMIEEDCTACELCVTTCPEVFEMGDEIAQVIAGADFEANEDCIREAAEDCPVEVIHFEED
jgi:ferredoxin